MITEPLIQHITTLLWHYQPPIVKEAITIIKTSGSESRGQEEAVCTRNSGLRDHYSELYTWMVGLNF